MEFEIDSSQFPLVKILYPEKASNAGISAYGKALSEVMSRGRLATVIDLRQVAVFAAGAEQRKFLAEQVDAATLANPGQLLAEAVIFNSKVLKAAYTAFKWMRKDNSFESRAFTDLENAQSWAESQLKQAGLL